MILFGEAVWGTIGHQSGEYRGASKHTVAGSDLGQQEIRKVSNVPWEAEDDMEPTEERKPMMGEGSDR